MKLLQSLSHATELKTVNESTAPVSYELTIKRILEQERFGVDLDIYEVFAIANLVEFFSQGKTNVNLQLASPMNPGSLATSVDATSAVRSLTKEQLTKLLGELKDLVAFGSNVVPGYADAPTNIADWMAYVLKAQD